MQNSVGEPSTSIFKIPVMWDFPHLLNLSINDILQNSAKYKSNGYLKMFIERSNLFSKILGHGKNNSTLKHIAKTEGLKLNMPLIYKMQR